MLTTINKLATKVEAGEYVKPAELKAIYPDELIDILVRKMKPSKAHSFKETCLQTKRHSKLGQSCMVLLGVLPRSKLFSDINYCSLTPTIPLVFALQNGFDFSLNCLSTEEAFDERAKPNRAYSLWDTPENKNAEEWYQALALGMSLSQAYASRQPCDLMTAIQSRRRLNNYNYPLSKGCCSTKMQFIQEAQIWNAQASKRDARMILDINDWDRLPEAML